jgi:hypothetical protein
MCHQRLTSASLGLAVLLLATACSRAEKALTPEEAHAKGDAMLKQMSQTLAGLQAFSYRTEQTMERVRGNATEKTTDHFKRSTSIQRPNRIAFTDEGEDHNAAGWYDGKQLTIISNREKIWVRGPMPATLDEALDFLSTEYAIQLPTADLLYSNPYDAMMTQDTTGGWVNAEKVDTRTCEHLSYQQAVVDWQIWLTQDDRRLPCQLQITYKTQPLQPVARITFHDLNTAPTLSDATFTPSVPEGYQRIKLMRHATVEDKTVANDKGGSND